MDGILPLGTVVSLREAKTRLMIIGRAQRQTGETDGPFFDYASVLWPVGSISSNRFYLFNEADIESVWFVGLQDEQEFEFRSYLIEQKKQHPELFV